MLLQLGNKCPTSSAGPTFISTRALAMRSLANARGAVRLPSIIISGPMTKRIMTSLPEKVHSASAPYICMLNWTPMDSAVKRTSGLVRVNRRATMSEKSTTGSQLPSISMADLQTGHFSGRLERSQSVTQLSMQSWCASRVQGHGSTQVPGGSEGSWSVRQMKQRRGASGARAAMAMASMAAWGRPGESAAAMSSAGRV